MTQKEKAQRYEEALERARNLHKDAIDMGESIRAKQYEIIFPELAMSEEDKIRKDLIEWFDDFPDIIWRGHYKKDVIAWLEKQSEQSIEPNWCHHKVDLSNCSEEYRKAYYDGWNNCNMQHSQRNAEGNDIVKCLINGMKFYYEGNKEAMWGTEKFSMKVKDILNWLEKQGNKDSQVKLPTFTFDDILALQCCMETVKKVQEDKELYEKLNDLHGRVYDAYHLEKQGEQESINPDTLIQQRVDALADIVAEQNFTDELEPKFKEGEWITNGDYTWKIVEVKPLDYILQSQDGNIVDDTISHVDEHFHSFTIQDAKDGDVLFMDNGLANCIFIYKSSKNGIISKYASYNNFGFEGDHYLVLNDGYVIPATKEQRDTLFAKMKESGHRFDFEKKELKKVEQEQDSINPSEYINDIGGNGCYLKNTAQVSAWGEEDEKMVNDIIAAIDTLYYHGMVNWLKSLKRRYTWKPSEEQIIALNNAVLLNEDHYNGAVLSTLLEQLKKL